MRGLVHGLAAGMVLGCALGAFEGWVAPSLAGETRADRILGLMLLDGAVSSLVGGLVGAALTRRRPVRLPRLATWASVVLVGLGLSLALGTARDGLALLGPENERIRALGEPPASIEPGGRAVVLVSLDTVRADALEHMPHLQARAGQGLEFVNARSPSSWTLPAMASVHTGLPYPDHGAAQASQLGGQPARTGLHRERAALAEELKERDFSTAAVTTNPFNGMRYGLDRGFDHSWELSRDSLRRHALRRALFFRLLLPPLQDRGARVSDRAEQVLSAWSGGQYFLWLHYLDAHAPYSSDPSGFDAFGPCELPDCFDDWSGVRRGTTVLDEADRERVRGLYRSDLGYLDAQLERVLRGLDLERTLVIITADHGEGFWEGPSIEHGGTFREPEVAVPLVVLAPGLAPARIERPVDTTAVFDAMLSWVDGDGLGPLAPDGAPMTTAMGSLLFGQGSACTDGRFKLVFGSATPVLYDLNSDPEETRDVSAFHPEAVDALSACARRGLGGGEPGPALDARALHTMGYED